jgi:hypothetical protein
MFLILDTHVNSEYVAGPSFANFFQNVIFISQNVAKIGQN